MKNFESNLDRVISEYEGDELERRRAEVIAEQNKNGQLMREAGQEFSQLVQDMNSAGFKASKVMQVSEQWQECVNKL